MQRMFQNHQDYLVAENRFLQSLQHFLHHQMQMKDYLWFLRMVMLLHLHHHHKMLLEMLN
jgi:hypothetical protein